MTMSTNASPPSIPLLQVENLAVRIATVEVLTDVSFSIATGSAVAVVGETGSGKSISCRAVAGLLPRLGGRIVRGRVTFGSQDLAGATAGDWARIRGRRIGFIPQASIASLDPVMKIGTQLRETIKLLDPGADPTSRAEELLQDVRMHDIDRVAQSYPHQLSGGMRQRVMIALALAGNPELLVADEPTTALDATVQRSILELLTKLRQEKGMSLLVVTHDLSLAESFADEIVVMYSGVTVERGPTAALLHKAAHPYTRALVAARVAAAGRGQPLKVLPGSPLSPARRPAGCNFQPRCSYAERSCESDNPPAEPVGVDHISACFHSEAVLKASS
jgi:peptide/nickel transport system ATP-binding protein